MARLRVPPLVFVRDTARSWFAICRSRVLLFLTLGVALARGAEVIPPPPANHFNDYAAVVKRTTAEQLNRELTQFERDTSTQILVAIFPRMQSPSSIEDYTVRVFAAWHPGQKRQSNGAILFIFAEEHRMRIATGYGVEGALPDALCKQILENEIAPRLRAGNFDAAMTSGVHAMMAAVRGEYKGSGRTKKEQSSGDSANSGWGIAAFIAFIIFMSILKSRRRGVVYGRSGRRGMWGGSPWIGTGGGGSSWGGGGGGGSFSGGGGSTGGGGASGSW